MKYKVGIAGYGIVGERRKKFIEINPNLNLVAICDKLKEKRADIEDDISFFTDYTDLLNLDLDIIFVCMTNDIAPEVTINSLKKDYMFFVRNLREEM
jgi:predicted dehydrogenase